MHSYLAQIVSQAAISRLSLIGLAKNVGKTTTTNHLLETLVAENHYRADELALTSLGLDGEAVDALTGLPKPRYVPQAGLLIVTTAELLRQAENEGARVERLLQLPGRTALGPVVLARILEPGRVIIAGPTLLRDLHWVLDKLQGLGVRLGIVDGAINRLGAASPGITDACIVCTGASVGATPELVARRTRDVLQRLNTQQTEWSATCKKLDRHIRLLVFSSHGTDGTATIFSGSTEPPSEAEWIVSHLTTHETPVYVLRGALTEELARALLAQLSTHSTYSAGELVIEDATRIFCHSVVLKRLSERGLDVRVIDCINILAIASNPYTPEYVCSPQRLLDALQKELLPLHPPIIDVVSGLFSQGGL
ncbi:MAG TPA: hypothetical protein VF043_22350 [Ktedonobacteraceae bacterium]